MTRRGFYQASIFPARDCLARQEHPTEVLDPDTRRFSDADVAVVGVQNRAAVRGGLHPVAEGFVGGFLSACQVFPECESLEAVAIVTERARVVAGRLDPIFQCLPVGSGVAEEPFT